VRSSHRHRFRKVTPPPPTGRERAESGDAPPVEPPISCHPSASGPKLPDPPAPGRTSAHHRTAPWRAPKTGPRPPGRCRGAALPGPHRTRSRGARRGHLPDHPHRRHSGRPRSRRGPLHRPGARGDVPARDRRAPSGGDRAGGRSRGPVRRGIVRRAARERAGRGPARAGGDGELALRHPVDPHDDGHVLQPGVRWEPGRGRLEAPGLPAGVRIRAALRRYHELGGGA